MTVEIRSPASDEAYGDLTPRQKRREILSVLARPMVGGVLLVLLYYFLPLDRAFGVETAVFFVLGFLAVVALIALQVRQIAASRYPRLRAVGALGLSIPMFLLLFATVYYLLAHSNHAAFTEPLSRTDALYFTITVFSTVGFGDIAPRFEDARVIVMFQMMGDLILIGVIGKVLLGAVSLGLQRRRPAPPEVGG